MEYQIFEYIFRHFTFVEKLTCFGQLLTLLDSSYFIQTVL